ncbi:MAG: CBS domain-containing protein [Parvularculaceae bacterium]
MKIKDRPEYAQKTDILRFSPGVTVAEAVKAMSTKNYGSSLVIDENEKLLGIFTERDLMRRVVANDVDPATTPLRDVMTDSVKVATAEDSLIDWLRIMSNERFRHLPVVDEDGRVVTIMSQGDFVSYTWPDLLQRVGEQARATIAPNVQIAFMVGGVMLYTIVMMLIFAA